MGQKAFPLIRNGKPRLQLQWERGVRNVSATLDGKPIGVIFGDKATLKEEQELIFGKGHRLGVRYITDLTEGFDVTLNGRLLPGSKSDPRRKLSSACALIFLFGVISLYASMFLPIFLYAGIACIVIGILMLAKPRIGLWLGVGVVILLSVLDIATLIIQTRSGSPSAGALTSGFGVSLLIRGLELYILYGAIKGLPALEQEKAFEQTPAAAQLRANGGASAVNAGLRYWGKLLGVGLGIMIGIPMLCAVIMALIPAQAWNRVFPAANSPQVNQRPVSAALPTKAPQINPTAAGTPLPPCSPVPTGFPELSLNITLQTAKSGINLADPPGAPHFEGDVAYNRPTFANAYYADGYPVRVTDGEGGGWRSASSNGTWLYVELDGCTTIRQIINNLFVDTNFTRQPHHQYLVSNDLQTWYIVYDEVNTKNDRSLRYLTLKEDVTARYVGVYAADWSGGWEDMSLFAVMPPDRLQEPPTPTP